MQFIKTVNAFRHIQPMPDSSTNALLIICDDGKEYVLKHPGCQTDYGTNILIAEYLSYLIAKRFNLPIPEYALIAINKHFLKTIEDEDIYNMMSNSPELCIGSVFIHGAVTFSNSLNLKVKDYKFLLKTIFGFDQYIYNADRFPENPNLLLIPQRMELMVIDHSLAIWPILDYKETLDAPVKTRHNHILYPYIKGNMDYVVKIVKEIYDVTISCYIDTIPKQWFNSELNKGFLTNFLTVRRDNIDNILKGESRCPRKNANLSLF